MRWRFQFRLRTLLILLVAVCVALGSRHLYFEYFGPYVEAGPAVAGQPFVVRGRFFDFMGNEAAVYVVQVSRLNSNGQRVVYQSASGRAERKGLWAYDFEVELARIRKPGDFDIELLPLTKAVAARKKHTPADSVYGHMVVQETVDRQE